MKKFNESASGSHMKLNQLTKLIIIKFAHTSAFQRLNEKIKTTPTSKLLNFVQYPYMT